MPFPISPSFEHKATVRGVAPCVNAEVHLYIQGPAEETRFRCYFTIGIKQNGAYKEDPRAWSFDLREDEKFQGQTGYREREIGKLIAIARCIAHQYMTETPDMSDSH